MALAIPLLNLNNPENTQESIVFKVFYVAISACIALCVMLVCNVALQFVLLLTNNNRGVVGEHEYEIREDGLLEKTRVNESVYRWAGFHRIAGSRNYLFVFVTDNNVHYFPRSCFSSPEHAAWFRDELMRKWKAAQC